MIDKDEQLRSAAGWQTKTRRVKATRLSEALSELVGVQISPRQARLGRITEFWLQLLPDELCRHSKIVSVRGGQLKVQVDSPSYLYELRLCQSQLLEELQRRCPQARVKAIKLVV